MRKLISCSWFATILMGSFAVCPGRAWAQSGTITDDAFLSANPTTQGSNQNGQGTSLIVAGSSAKNGTVLVGTTRTLIKFQLQSSLPPATSAANVVKATLKLYINTVASSPTGSIDIYTVTSAWTESTLNPSTPPTLSATAFATAIPVGPANSFLVVDVTLLVQEWLKGSAGGGLDNDGIALLASTSTSLVGLDSKESSATSHEPRLEIMLLNGGPQGPMGPQGPVGPAGATGATGASGKSATIAVGTTTTVAAGTPASVLNGGTASAAILNFLIPQGPAGITNRGVWNKITAYARNDAVTDSASYWLAISANTNSEPTPANTNWQLLAGGIANRGVWSAAKSYKVNDAVGDRGSFWLALVPTSASTAVPNTSCEPPIQALSPCAADWQLLAAHGTQGVPGQTGQQGPQGIQGPMGPAGPMPVGAAITTSTNTFTASQTINGNLILGGAGNGVKFPDGTTQTTAFVASSGVPSGFMILGNSSTPPAGYTLSGTLRLGNEWAGTAQGLRAMITSRSGLVAASVNGKIYAIGGSGTTGDLGTLEVYDPSTNFWTELVAMPTARNGLAAAAVGTKIYAIGGNNAFAVNGVLSTVEVYDTVAGTWTSAASPSAPALMPTARRNLAAVSIGTKIYAIDGDAGVILPSGGTELSTVEVYDTLSNTWTSVAPTPTARIGLAAASVGGKIYAIGGFNGGGPVPDVNVYDPATNVWSDPAGLLYARSDLAAATVGGKIYAIGGNNSGPTPVSVVEVYDPTVGSWSTAPSIPTPRWLLAATDANGFIYAIGGADTTTGPLAVIEQYTPPTKLYTFRKN